MNETTTIVIIGIYTLIYLVVFIIQQNQIKKQAGIISSMESFIKIFDVEQVRKFVEMKHETSLLVVEKVISQKALEMTEEKVRPILNTEIEKLKGEMSERFDEFANSAIDMILLLPKELQTEYIESAFPLNKQILLNVIKEIEKTELETELTLKKLTKKPNKNV